LETIIYLETDPRQLAHLLRHFLDELPGGMDHAAADQVISVIEDAWNYLPHKRLGGRSPADLMHGARRASQ
jgi:hypothetical protein